MVDDPKVALPTVWVPERGPGVKNNRATDAGRGTQVDVWAVEEVIGRGYALATFYCGDVAPDHPGHADGVFPHFLKPGQSKPGPHDWGAVAAWAWGFSRAVDYLATDPDIDAARIAVVGHSRLGKAAIVAAAFDERIALVIPHQAGCGGTAPSRGKVGESVKRINTSFPHWFDAEFKNFNDQPERLPFDQNCLVALVAPRPVLFTNAVVDTWANPEGQFQVLQAAEPVYRLLGAGGLDARSMPEIDILVTAPSATTSAPASTRWAARTGRSSSSTPTRSSAGRSRLAAGRTGLGPTPWPLRDPSSRCASCSSRLPSPHCSWRQAAPVRSLADDGRVRDVPGGHSNVRES